MRKGGKVVCMDDEDKRTKELLAAIRHIFEEGGTPEYVQMYNGDTFPPDTEVTGGTSQS